jgi:outer membrane receptor protein involved in Fe transport
VKRLVVVLVLLLACAIPAHAAALAGHVTDAAGAPLADVVVTVPELGLRAITHADGSFALPAAGSGAYTLVVRRSGYAPARIAFQLPASSPLEVKLAATPFEIAPVQVTASRAPVDPDRSPQPSATLSGERLQREHTVSLAQAIEELPGMRNLSTGEQVGKPVIRGLAGPRVLVLEDGYRLEDYSWSDEDGPSVDAWLTDRVEVVRGPASVLYGSDALGGVVNAVPADLPSSASGKAMTRAAAGIYGASNNSEFGSALRLEHAAGGFGGRLFVVGRHGDDVSTPAGSIHNTGFGAFNGETALGLRGMTSSATLRAAHYGGEFKLLEADAPPGEQQEEEGGPERKTSDNRVQLGGNLLLGGIRFESKAQWQNHSLIEVADEPGDSAAAGGEAEQFHLVLDSYELDLLGHHGKEGAAHGTIGVSGLAQTNDTRGPIPLVPDARTLSASAFALEQVDDGPWSYLAGGRFDQRHLEADNNLALALPDQSRDDTQGSLQFGLVYRLSGALSLAGNAGKGWRSPSLFELYANGPHIGESRYELGDPELEPERSIELDASLRWRAERARAELTGFQNMITDFIFLVPNGTHRVVGADTLDVYLYDQADANLIGGEAWGELEATRSLVLRARADYVSGQNQKTDSPLPQIPPFRAAVESELHTSKLKWAEQARVGIEAEYVANQNRLGPFDEATGAYTLIHLDAGMAHAISGRPFRFELRVRNLTDHAYRDFMSRYKRFALDPGRNVVLQISTGL